MSLERNAAFDNLDALLAASMDDLDDLPPMGVPPTGHYNLEVKIERTTFGDENKECVKATYKVLSVNEVKNQEEAGDAAEGMQFTEMWIPTKKDGTVNTFGIAALKERLKPFVEPAGTTGIADLIAWANNISIAATIVRTVDKKNEDQYRMRMKDVIVL